MTTTHKAYTARQCPECKAWVPCASAKSTAIGSHWLTHTEAVEQDIAKYKKTGMAPIGIPYAYWNETDVEVTV